MYALLMTGPSQGADRTEIREIEKPRPGPGEVTIDVAYAGVNFMDVMARRGDAGYVGAWPYAPGLEVSGAVREIGPDVTGLAVGERVGAFTAGGGVAELVPVLGGGLRIGTVGRPVKIASALKSGYDVAVARGEDLAEAVRAATA